MLLAGFDAGQTSTRCRIGRWQDGRWEPVGDGYGPGVCHLASAGGVERFQDAIRVSSTEAMNVHPDLTLDGAVMGASGIEQGSIIQEQATDLLARTLAKVLASRSVACSWMMDPCSMPLAPITAPSRVKSGWTFIASVLLTRMASWKRSTPPADAR